MEFSQRLKQIMDQKSVTMYRLAKELGVHQTTIKNWLDGKGEPRFAQIQAIAAALGVHVGSLIDDPNRFDVEDIKDAVIYGGPIGRVVENMQQLNLAGRERVEAYSADILKIAEYREDGSQTAQTAPQSTPPPQEGKDTTPPPGAPETPSEGG